MIKIFGENQELWQWDLDRRVVVGVDCVEIHFANALQSDALGVEIYEQDGRRFANVPNCLLQVAVPLIVYAEEAGGRTRCAYNFEIRPRAKPADYVYTETEVRTVKGYVHQALEEAKESGDFDGPKGVSGVYYGNDEPGEEYDVWIIPNGGEPVARGIDANGNETEYSSVSLALIDSVSVTMIADSTESVITVPAGVTLDLNGHTLTADVFTSYGDIVDGEDGGNGLLKYVNGLIPNNSFLPIYDSANSGYRLYKYTLYLLGGVNITNGITYHATLDFRKLSGFKLISESENAHLRISFNLKKNNSISTVIYDLPETELKTWASDAYTNYNDPNFYDWVTFMMKITGITVSSYTPYVVLTTGTGMTVTAE